MREHINEHASATQLRIVGCLRAGCDAAQIKCRPLRQRTSPASSLYKAQRTASEHNRIGPPAQSSSTAHHSPHASSHHQQKAEPPRTSSSHCPLPSSRVPPSGWPAGNFEQCCLQDGVLVRQAFGRGCEVRSTLEATAWRPLSSWCRRCTRHSSCCRRAAVSSTRTRLAAGGGVQPRRHAVAQSALERAVRDEPPPVALLRLRVLHAAEVQRPRECGGLWYQVTSHHHGLHVVRWGLGTSPASGRAADEQRSSSCCLLSSPPSCASVIFRNGVR